MAEMKIVGGMHSTGPHDFTVRSAGCCLGVKIGNLGGG